MKTFRINIILRDRKNIDYSYKTFEREYAKEDVEIVFKNADTDEIIYVGKKEGFSAMDFLHGVTYVTTGIVAVEYGILTDDDERVVRVVS